MKRPKTVFYYIGWVTILTFIPAIVVLMFVP
jgi:hypothetical protein